MNFYDLNHIEYKLKRAGVRVKTISGERSQIVLTKLDPGFESDHSHPQEQMGIVLSGQIVLTIENKTRTCGAGEGYLIPPDVRHSFKVSSGSPAEILDIFSPPKEENCL
jgi:quercetin dioxygenase-like cupin family protein